MVITVTLKDGTWMEVRIKEKLIDEVFYSGNIEQVTLQRKDSEHIKMWLKDILKSDVEKFKKILSNIPEDPIFFNYGKALLAAERERKVENLLDYRRECNRRLEQLQAEVDRYKLPE